MSPREAPSDLPLRPRLEQAFALAEQKVRATIERTPDFFPIYTSGGKWKHDMPLWTDWCAGFHAGLMWLIWHRTRDPWWRSQAEHYSRLIEHKQHDTAVHDLGFIFLNTYLPWFGATSDPRLCDVLIQAGRTLARRFQPKGQYLCSFLGPNSLFIDIMMNVPIIFHAARETHDAALLNVATQHCRTTERCLVRPDGSTAHEGLFDLASGEFVRQSTQQGYGAQSTWSRGLAWALHGYSLVYGYTRDRRDLDVARRCADCLLRRLPTSRVPPWDFDAPETPERLADSSAGAIAASGLLELSNQLSGLDPSAALTYHRAACEMLSALCAESYLSLDDPQWEGILKHGVYHIHQGLGVDESVMWGEYYLVRAVCRMLERPLSIGAL